MLPLEKRFSRDFFIDEVLERYDERRNETRKIINQKAFLYIDNDRQHLFQSKFDLMGFTDYLILLIVPISQHAIFSILNISR
jgi:hypothetical protein